MIDIVLSTYNGNKFLDAQLSSIFAQTRQDFQLSVLDDASNDETVNILQRWQSSYPSRISIRVREQRCGMPGYNFFDLLEETSGSYIMFADQDDVWDLQKIERSMAELVAAENGAPETPLLVHTDLSVVDEDLNPIAASFIKMSGLNPEFRSLERLVAQNNVTGCTMTLNRALANVIRRPRLAHILHDWWIAMTAAAFGRIVFLPHALVNYRQHGNNAVGARDTKSLAYIAKRASGLESMKSSLEATYCAAREFRCVYEDLLNVDQMSFLDGYADLGSASIIGRTAFLIKHNAFKNGFIRQIGQIIAG